MTKRNFLFDLPFYIGKPPNMLWSRGWYGVTDVAGDGSIFYRAQRTQRRQTNLRSLIGREGVIWLRLGSSAWHKGKPSDVITFAEQVVGRLGGSYVLVTTDGDISVPGELPGEVVSSILGDKNLKAWFTQNYDGSLRHAKLRPIPCGLDLHTRQGGRSIRPSRKASWLNSAIREKKSFSDRVDRIWSDVHFKSNPGRHGNPRGAIQAPIFSGQLSDTVDAPSRRLSHQEVWACYGSYRFVLSLPGAGLEAHRTWEALALGAIVITVHTSLDPLLNPYKVIFIDQSERDWWEKLGDRTWLTTAGKVAAESKELDLSWDFWEKIVRQPLLES